MRKKEEDVQKWLQHSLDSLSQPVIDHNSSLIELEISDPFPSPMSNSAFPTTSEIPEDYLDTALMDIDREDDEPTTSSGTVAEPKPHSNSAHNIASLRGDPIKRKLSELHGIFVSGGVTLRVQDQLLDFMRELTESVREALPHSGRTLRPPQILHTLRPLAPGNFVYFGIEAILSMPEINLFNKRLNEVNFSIMIDGVPMCSNGKGIGFWPILGCVECYPVFLIAMYEGVDKPVCANEYLKKLVDELKRLHNHRLHVDGDTYKFRLIILITDAPAMAYILGVKEHTPAITAAESARFMGKECL